MKHEFMQTAKVAVALALAYGLMLLRPGGQSLILEGAIFLASLYALVAAAHVFTEVSTEVGDFLGFSRLATGILIIAIGTSAPEFFASLGATLQGQPEIAVGNILGTVVANCLLGIGCGALAASVPLTVHRDVFGTQMSTFLAAIFIAMGGLYDGVLNWYDGAILVTVLAFYLNHVIKTAKINPASEVVPHGDHPHHETSNLATVLPLLFVLLVLNLGGLFISGDFVVSALIEGGEILEFSSTKLATSVLAVGTSIPEIATAIALVRQNKPDSLFGEIIGSNIFDVLGVLGLLSLFTPLTLEPTLLVYLGGSMVVTFMLTNMVMNDMQINRLEGVGLVSLFGVFTIQLVNL